MTSPLMDARSVLSIPAVYSAFRKLVRGRGDFVAEYVCPVPGEAVLDIGCGPGEMLRLMPGVRYTGIDHNANYIEAARQRHGDKGTFIRGDAGSNAVPGDVSSYDLALAIGVLHHLDDASALALFRLAHRALKRGGRLITLDGCYTPEQSKLARFILSKDRGKYVRTSEQYMAIATQVFPNCEASLRTDLLRIPYTHLIIRAKKS